MGPEEKSSELLLCRIGDVREGEPHRVEVPGFKPYALFMVEGRVYVTDDVCSHGQASLGDEGELDGFNIICTWHDGAFDVRTGQATALPCTKPIRCYPVSLRDDAIHITITG